MSTAKILKQPLKRRLLFLFLVTSVVGLSWFGSGFIRESIGCWRIQNLLMNSELDPALQAASQLVESCPDCAQCQFLLAKAARRSGQFSVASSALSKAMDAGWDSAQIKREQVLATAQSGQVKLVERELMQVFESDLNESETAEVYEALAYGHLAAFDAPEFLRSLQFWLEWQPEAIKPRLLKSEFYVRIQQFSKAIDEYKALLEIHPACVEARTALGENLLELNFPKEAAEQLQISFDQKPTDRTALLLAQCWVETDNAEKAKTLLQRYEDTPNEAIRAMILAELGRWYSDRDAPEKALEYLQQSVKLAPESASAWHSLSSVFSMLGRHDEAVNAQNVSRITQQRCQRLFDVITKLSAKPESIQLRLDAASILFEQGMDTDAVAWLRTILSIELHHREANRLLAEYYQKSGRLDLVAEHLKLAGLEPLPSK